MKALKQFETDINDIKIMVARMEEHMKNMNGKLIDVSAHVNTRCPTYRKDIYNKVDDIKSSSIKANAILGVLLTLAFFLLTKLT